MRLRDLDSGNTLFETTLVQGFINSSKRWFVRFRIEIWDGEDTVLSHDYDARGQPVLIQFPVGTLGDTMGWFPYAVRFADQHGCRLTCAMSALIIPLFRDAYPQISFVAHEAVEADRFYATYCLGPVLRRCRLRLAANRFPLGWAAPHRRLHPGRLTRRSSRPNCPLPDESRPIDEPYVCIGVQSSSGCKYWNNPLGWRVVVAWLKEHGYRVICIDQKPVHGTGLVWTHIPHGAEDQTGDLPLTERARWLRHSAGFVGLSQRPRLARLGRGRQGADDQRLHPPDQRVRHAMAGA